MPEAESKSYFKMKIAMKYSVQHDCLIVNIFRFFVKEVNTFFSLIYTLLKCNIFQSSGCKLSDHIHSKVSMFYEDNMIYSKKNNSYKNKRLIDFSKDHKYKLNGESISQFKVEIEIKTSTPLWEKSKKMLDNIVNECMRII